MAYEELDTDFAVGDPVRASWMNQIGANSANHEERLADVETTVSDHESRIDLLEGTGPAAVRMLVADVTVDHSQITQLPITPVTIVAVPSLNYRVKFHSATYFTWFENGPYGNVDASYATLVLETAGGTWLSSLILNDTSIVPNLGKLTTLFGASSRTYDLVPYGETSDGWLHPVGGATNLTEANLVRLALDNNGAGALTGGHTSNRFNVRLYYLLEAVPAYTMPVMPAATQAVAHRRSPRRVVHTSGASALTLIP